MKLCKELYKNDNYQMTLKEKCVSPFKGISKLTYILQKVNIGHTLVNVEMKPFIDSCVSIHFIYKNYTIKTVIIKSILCRAQISLFESIKAVYAD